jgi:sterol desaturase/sphingolipid hydroxylase (fatty acid hydroxylase superfamily)
MTKRAAVATLPASAEGEGRMSPTSVSEVSVERSIGAMTSHEKEAACEESSDKNTSNIVSSVLPWIGVVVWPLMLALPLILTSSLSPISYDSVFPAAWYEYDATSRDEWPKPLGLSLGIIAVAIGQVFVISYFFLHKYGYLSCGAEPTSIQTKGSPDYEFTEGIATHLAQPEGFFLLATYLSVTWMFHLMPNSYYSFQGGIQWKEVALCLILQDGIQYVMHRLEHVVSPAFYQMSHKPHHRFTNPRMFDAFNGSPTDTICMILIPLYITANLVRTCNVWTYMAFGSTYANWLTLIHSEYMLPWDCIFRKFGLGTPGDHHVHHKFFKFNYGHLFMWWDQLGGTYRDPNEFSNKAFHENV